jgi:hypothetical protein
VCDAACILKHCRRSEATPEAAAGATPDAPTTATAAATTTAAAAVVAAAVVAAAAAAAAAKLSNPVWNLQHMQVRNALCSYKELSAEFPRKGPFLQRYVMTMRSYLSYSASCIALQVEQCTSAVLTGEVRATDNDAASLSKCLC